MALGRRHSYTPRVSFTHYLNTYIPVGFGVNTKPNTYLLEQFVTGAYHAVDVGVRSFHIVSSSEKL